MPAEFVNNALKAAPSAATGVVATLPGGFWLTSPWVEIIASTPNAIVVTTLVTSKNTATSGEFEVELGSGAAGVETVLATVRKVNIQVAEVAAVPLPLPVPIGAGIRVVMRGRKSSVGGDTHQYSLSYYDQPISGLLTTSTVLLRTAPSAANGVTITPSSTAWANSSWVEVNASTTAAWALAAVALRPDALQPAGMLGWELDVGTGAGGAEVVQTTMRCGGNPTGDMSGGVFYQRFLTLFTGIGSGVRVAVRLRKAGTTTNILMASLGYYHQPVP